MKEAVHNLLENKDPQRLVHQLSRMFYIMIGLCIALVFALGFDIIQWNTNGNLDHKINKQAIVIHAIQNANHVAKIASAKTCAENRPRTQALVGGLAAYFKAQKAALVPLLQEDKGTKLHKSREKNYANIDTVQKILYSYLPIKCPAKQNSKHAKRG